MAKTNSEVEKDGGDLGRYDIHILKMQLERLSKQPVYDNFLLHAAKTMGGGR